MVFCANSTEEAAISTGFMTLSRSCFERSRTVNPWMIITASSIA